MEAYEVLAHRDAEAGVWWAESDDVPGLAAEAETLEGLIEDLEVLVPELLHLNHGGIGGRIPLRVVANRGEEPRIA